MALAYCTKIPPAPKHLAHQQCQSNCTKLPGSPVNLFQVYQNAYCTELPGSTNESGRIVPKTLTLQNYLGPPKNLVQVYQDANCTKLPGPTNNFGPVYQNANCTALPGSTNRLGPIPPLHTSPNQPVPARKVDERLPSSQMCVLQKYEHAHFTERHKIVSHDSYGSVL